MPGKLYIKFTESLVSLLSKVYRLSISNCELPELTLKLSGELTGELSDELSSELSGIKSNRLESDGHGSTDYFFRN